jgi:hypothetical protein
MGMYTPDKLWSLWKHEEIDSQMVIGHLLQNLVEHQRMLKEAKSSLQLLKREVDNLYTQVKILTQNKIGDKKL